MTKQTNTKLIDSQVKVFGNLEIELAFLSHKLKRNSIPRKAQKTIAAKLLSCSMF